MSVISYSVDKGVSYTMHPHLTKEQRNSIKKIITKASFRGVEVEHPVSLKEGVVVQDLNSGWYKIAIEFSIGDGSKFRKRYLFQGCPSFKLMHGQRVDVIILNESERICEVIEL